MGVMDKFLNAMRLNSDEEDYYDEDDFYDDDEEVEEEEDEDYEPRRRSLFGGRRNRDDDFDDEDEDDFDDEPRSTVSAARSISQPSASKVTPMRSVRRSSSSGSTGMEVCVIKPISVEDAREITETLLSNRTVILNVEGLDLEIAQRIIDFTSGSCYAINGNLQKVSNYIFVVTPANVDISGDIQNIMSAFGGASTIQTDI